MPKPNVRVDPLDPNLCAYCRKELAVANVGLPICNVCAFAGKHLVKDDVKLDGGRPEERG